jgi:DNA-binding transcriptional LysR family regulator
MGNILDGIEALLGLQAAGTASEAGVRLRLTQSAVSKRIKALEASLGHTLVEPDGRRVRLTATAVTFLAQARPLVSQLNALRSVTEGEASRELSIVVSDSIASSWGPKVLRQALAGARGVSLEIHVDRSLLALERLRLGQYELGLVTGRPSAVGLVWTPVAQESMVLVGPRSSAARKILTIEPASGTWREIGPPAVAHPQLKDRELVFLESFAAAAQMAKAGFGRALVPLGTATALGFKDAAIERLSPRLRRQIHFVARKGVLGLKSVQGLAAALAKAAAATVR